MCITSHFCVIFYSSFLSYVQKDAPRLDTLTSQCNWFNDYKRRMTDATCLLGCDFFVVLLLSLYLLRTVEKRIIQVGHQSVSSLSD